MVVEGERYPAPVTVEAKRRRRVKRLLIWFAVLLALTVVAFQLKSMLYPTFTITHG